MILTLCSARFSVRSGSPSRTDSQPSSSFTVRIGFESSYYRRFSFFRPTQRPHSPQSPFSETKGKGLLPPRKGYGSLSHRRDLSTREERKEMPQRLFARSHFRQCRSSTPFSFPGAPPKPHTAPLPRQSPLFFLKSPVSFNLLPTHAPPRLYPTAQIRQCSLCRRKGSLWMGPSLPSSPSRLITTTPSPPPLSQPPTSATYTTRHPPSSAAALLPLTSIPLSIIQLMEHRRPSSTRC